MTRSISLALVLALSACGDDGPTNAGCAELLPGDLVITEVFADPMSADEGGEWFEVYNASGHVAQLDGLTLTHSRGDGTMPHEANVDQLSVDANGYAVFGNVDPDLRPAWVTAGYGAALGDLYNTGSGRLALRCGSTELDAATYGNVKSGYSRQLDGGHPPDYTVNDDQAQWCAASKTGAKMFSTGNYGTPGEGNEDCEIIVAGMCDDGMQLRPIVPPGLGDLVITEVMPNPSAVPDAMGEWFEVQALREVDLNGLTIDRLGDTNVPPEVITQEKCIHVQAGAHVVFAHFTDAGINGGLPPVAATFKVSLVSGTASTPGDISIGYNTTTIDSVSWTSSRTGASIQVDPDAANAAANDLASNFCDGTQPFGEGDLGTPGFPNAQCPLVTAPGTCVDGSTPRPLVTPVPGDLVITEVMPSPNAVSDTVGEWFEVLATRDVDLNGLGLDRASDTANPNVISSATCIRLTAGQRAVFAKSSEVELNGGIPGVAAGFSFSLISGSMTTPGDVQILSGTTVLDAVTWTRSTSGAALQLDPDLMTTTDNDLETSWCDAAMPYGTGDLGTPGGANMQCSGGPAPGMCLDAGVPRALVSPVPGDLVITEVMPNPGAVSDTLGEWFEVLVTRDVDLNGVGLDRAGDSAAPNVIASADCVRVAVGTRLVFAKNADPLMNGGLPAVTKTFTFSLIDGTVAAPGDVQLVLGTTTLDSVLWTHSSSATSHQLDPDFSTITGNDDEANWCDSAVPYGLGDLGSPGTANAQCGSVTPPNMCDMGGGVLRPIVKPAAGALVITEIMPNPKVEPGQEWFEITNTGATAFDLNGLGLDRAGDTRPPDVVTSTACLAVAPQGFGLFARSIDMMTNGGLPAPDATFGFSMVNTSGDVQVLDGMTVLDAVTWTSSTDGVASQLDPDFFTTAGNDVAANSCAATAAYGDLTNKGTPRAANAQCP